MRFPFGSPPISGNESQGQLQQFKHTYRYLLPCRLHDDDRNDLKETLLFVTARASPSIHNAGQDCFGPGGAIHIEFPPVQASDVAICRPLQAAAFPSFQRSQ